MRDYKNYQIKIQDRTDISRYSHSFPGKYIKSKSSSEGGQLNGARRTKKKEHRTNNGKERKLDKTTQFRLESPKPMQIIKRVQIRAETELKA